MKNKLLLALAFGVASNATFAVCPNNINGGWSGSNTASDQSVITTGDNTSILNGSSYSVLTLNINGSSGVSNYFAGTDAGPGNGVEQSTTPTAVGVSYDKAGCKGTITTPEETVYFTVSNNGKTLRGVSYKSNSGTFDGGSYKEGKAKLWEMEKQ